MKKRFLILIVFLFFIFLNNANADLTDYNSGNTGELGNLSGNGSWDRYHVGVKISIASSYGTIKDSEIIWNNSGYYSCKKFSVSNYPKIAQETPIKWKNVAGSEIPKTSLIPSYWTPDDKMINLATHLSNSNYSNLLGILDLSHNNRKLFSDLKPGDYIIVEPMTYIDGYCGTAFEFSNAFMTINKNLCTTDGNFCYKYAGAVFGGNYSNGNPSRKCGGIFWQTIFLNTNIEELGLNAYKLNANEVYNSELACYIPNETRYQIFTERDNCLKSQTCGRGIGVYKYDDIYTGKLEITKKETSTNSGLPGAGFTLYSDSSCRYAIKSETKTNSSGVATFTNLATGSYYYKETTVPQGYIGDINCHKVDITNGQQKSVTVNNNKETKSGNLKVVVYKYPNENELITGQTVKVEIFKGASCTGESTEFSVTGSKIVELDEGNYSIKIKTAPSIPYTQVPGFTYTCAAFNINDSNTTIVKYPYTTSCESELALAKDDGTYTFNEALTLYNKYKDSKASLFDLDNPSCSRDLNCSSNLTASCLSASLAPVISSTNLSCADITTDDPTKRATTFCYEQFDLDSNLDTDTFYAISGQFLIKKVNIDNQNYYSWYDENWNNITIPADDGLATLKLTKTCYSINSDVSLESTINPKIFFGDNVNPLNLIKESSVSSHIESPSIAGLTKFQKTYEYIYDLNYKYIDALTGREVDTGINAAKLMQGVLINFNDDGQNKELPFEIEFNDKRLPITENSCKYNTKQEIIKYDRNTNGKLNLEFRLIDTTNPFVGRDPKLNWNDQDIIEDKILNATNSYGIKEGAKQEPKYKITLTPSDIDVIRKYNNEHPYDNYKIYCDENGECLNSFVYDLINGDINKYENNVIVEKYGYLSHKLETKDS